MAEREFMRHFMDKSLPRTIRETLVQALESNGGLLVLVSPDANFQTSAVQRITAEWRRQGGYAYHVHCPQEQEFPVISAYGSWCIMWHLFFGLTESDSGKQKFKKIEQRILTLCPEFLETMIVLQRVLVPQCQFSQAFSDYLEEVDQERWLCGLAKASSSGVR